MSPKNIFFAVLIALLGGIYIYNFTDWFHAPVIQIIPSIRPVRMPGQTGGALPVTFTMNADYKLTSIKVLPSADAERGDMKSHTLWHLVAANPEPIRGFAYGMNIPGMKPAESKANPEPLKPNETYRIYIEAGRAKGHADFQTHAPEE